MEKREIEGFIYFLTRRKGQKRLGLRIDDKGLIKVSAPYYVSYSKLDDFVSSNSQWIIQHQKNVPVRTYETGDKVALLGQQKALLVRDFSLSDNVNKRRTMSYYIINGEEIVVYAKNKDINLVKKEIKKMYINIVSKVLSDRVSFWAGKVGVNVPFYGVNSAKTKWGLCYPSQNRLYLSYMCAVLPYDLIDMIILHEVCHLKIAGHGEPFWSLMKTFMPDLEERKTRLRQISKTGIARNLV